MTRWQIFSAIALRKLPELMPCKSPIEAKVQEVFDRYEVAKSKFSNHELQHLEDIRIKESATEAIIRETAQDREDAWAKEMAAFEFGKYDDRLTYVHYLFSKQKFGTDIKDQWLLPQAAFDSKQDDNLLDTARRVLRESFDIVNGYRIVSKIPSSVYSFRYPKKIVDSTGFKGAKVFFLKAHLDHPSAAVMDSLDANKNENLQWLTKTEASKVVHAKYMFSFDHGLLHENRVDIDRVVGRVANYSKILKTKQEQMSQA